MSPTSDALVLQIGVALAQLATMASIAFSTARLHRQMRQLEARIADMEAEFWDDDPDDGEPDPALHIVRTEARAA